MKSTLAVACAAVVLAAGAPAHAVKVTLNEDAFMELRLLLQPQFQSRQNAASDGTGLGNDFFLRRARIIVSGNVTKKLSFFAETDTPNFGKGGAFDQQFYVQDAFGSYKFAPQAIVDAGLIINPFTHNSFQGAGTLNTVDYHGFLFKYPVAKVFRDGGVQLRGLLFGDRIHYRAGVFGGVRGTARKDAAGLPLPPTNPDSVPRVVGHLRYNFFEPETDFFLSGIYLGKKKVLSVGVGADFQPKAIGIGPQVSNYFGLGADLFLDLPLPNDQEAVFQLNYVRYDQGERNPGTGAGFFAEAGYRIHRWEPVVAFDRFSSFPGGLGYMAYRGGLNYWLDGHVTNIKLELAAEKDVAARKVANLDAVKKWTGVGTLQAQLLF